MLSCKPENENDSQYPGWCRLSTRRISRDSLGLGGVVTSVNARIASIAVGTPLYCETWTISSLISSGGMPRFNAPRMCSRSSGPRPSAISAVIVISERNLTGRPGRVQIVPNSCSLRKVANPSSKFRRNASPSCAPFSPHNFVRNSIPFFADSSDMRTPPRLRQLCVADHQAAVHRNDRARDVRRRGNAQAERDVRDFLGIAVAFKRGAALGENRLVLFWNRVGKSGANRSRANAVDRNSFRPEVDRQRARQSDDTGLGNCIGAVAGSRTEALRRRDIHDACGVGLAQMNERGADHPLLRSQQTGDGAIPDAVVVVGAERRESAKAGVVYQYIETAEVSCDLRDDAFDLGRIQHVEPPSVRSPAGGRDFFDDARHSRLIDIGDRDQRPFLCEQVSGGAAHPAGGAGDEHRASLHRAIELLHWFHLNSHIERALLHCRAVTPRAITPHVSCGSEAW